MAHDGQHLIADCTKGNAAGKLEAETVKMGLHTQRHARTDARLQNAAHSAVTMQILVQSRYAYRTLKATTCHWVTGEFKI